MLPWFFAPREQHKLGIFVNRVLKGILGLKTERVTVLLRNVFHEELNNVCSYICDHVKEGAMYGTCTHKGDEK
jgi:hypothetical protein